MYTQYSGIIQTRTLFAYVNNQGKYINNLAKKQCDFLYFYPLIQRYFNNQ